MTRLRKRGFRGKDLYEYLTWYRHHAKFTVIFISEAYGKKLWRKSRAKGGAGARLQGGQRVYFTGPFR